VQSGAKEFFCMDDAHRRLVTGWPAKAEDDLRVARLLIAEENRLNAAGAYHCQQAAEKVLKAWLTARNIVFPKTHDLETLLHLCRAAENGFGAYIVQARALTPLATEFRYPGDLFEPASEQARESLRQAADLFDYAAYLVRQELAGK
jgi:HEPN domain-containing protein